MKKYDGTYADGFVFDKPDQKIVLGKRSTVTDDDTAIMVTAKGYDITLGGEVFGEHFGVYGTRSDTSIAIKHGGSISSEVGIVLTGAHQSVTNAGDITAATSGIYIAGSAARVSNHGTINAAACVSLQNSDDGRVLNGLEGEIRGIYGVAFGSATETSENRLTNLGMIDALSFAVAGSSGADHVTNRGFIDGPILLAGGNDTFDGRRGATVGLVAGGPGDDRYFIDDAGIELGEAENDGEDVVISSVGYQLPDNFERLKLVGENDLVGLGNDRDNTIVGNRGDNQLYGYEGYNTLDGGLGNDVLFGGSEQDVFVFRTGSGRDTIENFQDNVDYLDLSQWKGMTDLDIVLQHAREVNGDLVISFHGDRLLLENVTKAQLDAGEVYL